MPEKINTLNNKNNIVADFITVQKYAKPLLDISVVLTYIFTSNAAGVSCIDITQDVTEIVIIQDELNYSNASLCRCSNFGSFSYFNAVEDILRNAPELQDNCMSKRRNGISCLDSNSDYFVSFRDGVAQSV
jgi:hypothetical protein